MGKRYFKIDIVGSGGELVIGRVKADFVDWFEGESKDLVDHIGTYGQYLASNDGSPRLEDIYSWQDCDNQEHLNLCFTDAKFSVTEVDSQGLHCLNENLRAVQFEGYHVHTRDFHFRNQFAGAPFPVVCFLGKRESASGYWIAETEGEDFSPRKFAYLTVKTPLGELVEKGWYNKTLLKYIERNDWADIVELTGVVGYLDTAELPQLNRVEGIDGFWEKYDKYHG